MCWFCEKIYNDKNDFINAVSDAWLNEEYLAGGIVSTNNGYNIVISDHDIDPSLQGIEYCPYCGRKLT